MSELELKAWTAFVSVMQNFLGNKKSENYIEEDLLLQLYKIIYSIYRVQYEHKTTGI